MRPYLVRPSCEYPHFNERKVFSRADRLHVRGCRLSAAVTAHFRNIPVRIPLQVFIEKDRLIQTAADYRHIILFYIIVFSYGSCQISQRS